MPLSRQKICRLFRICELHCLRECPFGTHKDAWELCTFPDGYGSPRFDRLEEVLEQVERLRLSNSRAIDRAGERADS